MYHAIWQLTIRQLKLNKRIHLYIIYLQKDGVLWCSEMQTTLKATEDSVYLSHFFVRFLLFYRKVSLWSCAGNALWKQEVQVIHVLRNVGKKPEDSVLLFLFLKGTLWIDLLSKKITPQVGKLLRKLFTGTFPSYSLLICLPCFIGLLLLS